MWREVEGEDGCERCNDSGIIGVFDTSHLHVVLVCHCEVGQNAKAANPNWFTESEIEKLLKEKLA